MKECLTDPQWTSDLLKVYEDLVQACLNRCGVYPSHPHRTDLEQIAYITLIKSVVKYRDDLTSEDSIDRFGGYVYQQIRWRVIDELRRLDRNRTGEQNLDGEHWQNLGTDRPRKKVQDQIETEDLYRQLYQRVSHRGKKYLDGAFCRGLTVTEMSRLYGVSRQSIYNWRNEVQKAAKQYLKKGEV